MSHAVAAQPVTVAEFNAFTAAQPDDTRWELVDGHILAMTNPNEDHGQIAYALGAALRDAAKQKGCRVNIGGLRVQASADMDATMATIPDITVRCGERVGRHWITDPVIVVEVLSPSTMDFDRGLKLDFYKSFPTMLDIVLLYQDQIRVEHYRREADGWAMAPLTRVADSLAFVGLPCSVGLAEIYAATGLDA